MKNKLAIVERWCPRFHGVGCNENIIRYFHIMEHLDFVTFLIDKKDVFEVTHRINKIYHSRDFYGGYSLGSIENRQLKIIVLKGGFTMRGRMFGIPNKSFLYFISKMKKRYKRKLDIKKSIKALRYRECHGRYLKR
jgi:hypothetical protein